MRPSIGDPVGPATCSSFSGERPVIGDRDPSDAASPVRDISVIASPNDGEESTHCTGATIVGGLDASVSPIATLDIDEFAAGLGVGIARKHSPVDLTFLSLSETDPAADRPDGSLPPGEETYVNESGERHGGYSAGLQYADVPALDGDSTATEGPYDGSWIGPSDATNDAVPPGPSQLNGLGAAGSERFPSAIGRTGRAETETVASPQAKPGTDTSTEPRPDRSRRGGQTGRTGQSTVDPVNASTRSGTRPRRTEATLVSPPTVCTTVDSQLSIGSSGVEGERTTAVSSRTTLTDSRQPTVRTRTVPVASRETVTPRDGASVTDLAKVSRLPSSRPSARDTANTSFRTGRVVVPGSPHERSSANSRSDGPSRRPKSSVHDWSRGTAVTPSDRWSEKRRSTDDCPESPSRAVSTTARRQTARSSDSPDRSNRRAITNRSGHPETASRSATSRGIPETVPRTGAPSGGSPAVVERRGPSATRRIATLEAAVHRAPVDHSSAVTPRSASDPSIRYRASAPQTDDVGPRATGAPQLTPHIDHPRPGGTHSERTTDSRPEPSPGTAAGTGSAVRSPSRTAAERDTVAGRRSVRYHNQKRSSGDAAVDSVDYSDGWRTPNAVRRTERPSSPTETGVAGTRSSGRRTPDQSAAPVAVQRSLPVRGPRVAGDENGPDPPSNVVFGAGDWSSPETMPAAADPDARDGAGRIQRLAARVSAEDSRAVVRNHQTPSDSRTRPRRFDTPTQLRLSPRQTAIPGSWSTRSRSLSTGSGQQSTSVSLARRPGTGTADRATAETERERTAPKPYQTAHSPMRPNPRRTANSNSAARRTAPRSGTVLRSPSGKDGRRSDNSRRLRLSGSGPAETPNSTPARPTERNTGTPIQSRDNASRSERGSTPAPVASDPLSVAVSTPWMTPSIEGGRSDTGTGRADRPSAGEGQTLASDERERLPRASGHDTPLVIRRGRPSPSRTRSGSSGQDPSFTEELDRSVWFPPAAEAARATGPTAEPQRPGSEHSDRTRGARTAVRTGTLPRRRSAWAESQVMRDSSANRSRVSSNGTHGQQPESRASRTDASVRGGQRKTIHRDETTRRDGSTWGSDTMQESETTRGGVTDEGDPDRNGRRWALNPRTGASASQTGSARSRIGLLADEAARPREGEVSRLRRVTVHRLPEATTASKVDRRDGMGAAGERAGSSPGVSLRYGTGDTGRQPAPRPSESRHSSGLAFQPDGASLTASPQSAPAAGTAKASTRSVSRTNDTEAKPGTAEPADETIGGAADRSVGRPVRSRRNDGETARSRFDVDVTTPALSLSRPDARNPADGLASSLHFDRTDGRAPATEPIRSARMSVNSPDRRIEAVSDPTGSPDPPVSSEPRASPEQRTSPGPRVDRTASGRGERLPDHATGLIGASGSPAETGEALTASREGSSPVRGSETQPAVQSGSQPAVQSRPSSAVRFGLSSTRETDDSLIRANRTIGTNRESTKSKPIGSKQRSSVEGGMHTTGLSERPSLTYRDTATASETRDGNERPATAAGGAQSVQSTGTDSRPESGHARQKTGPQRGTGRQPAHRGGLDERSVADESDATSGPFRSSFDRSDRRSPTDNLPPSEGSSTPGRPTEPPRSDQRSGRRDQRPDDRSQRDRRRRIDIPRDTGSMEFESDVDRIVERLYRKLERKQRIERKRRGL